jgi:hypothetical protein
LARGRDHDHRADASRRQRRTGEQTSFADWLSTVDPSRRMVNEFFGALLP